MKLDSLDNATSVLHQFIMTEDDFSYLQQLAFDLTGIVIDDAKREMVYSRIARRIRRLALNSFYQYCEMLRAEHSAEHSEFVNAITTNLTSFFREEHHFPILADHLKKLAKPIRIWCSAASTGEEPYTLAMTACEAFGTLKPPVEIIATDIDTNVLATASRGVYPYDRVSKLSEKRRKDFFLKGSGAQDGLVRVRNELRSLITFQQLNLLEPSWSLQEPFDAIFCRNVMIYFDKPTQTKILSRFVPLMKPHALLFAGHSENFLYVSNDFQLLGKTVYELRQGKSGKRNLSQGKETML